MGITHKVSFSASAKDAMAEVLKYGDTIVGVAQTVDKHAASLGGGKILAQANNWTAAVGKLGGATGDLITKEQLLAGASALTTQEKAKLNTVVSAAIAKYEALGKAAPSAMRDLEAATRPLPAVTDSWTTSVGKMAAGYITGMVTIQAAQRAFHELAGFVKESIAAAAEAEQVQVRLTSALTNTHQPVAATAAAFNAYAKHIQATTVLEDDAVVSVMALATEMGVTAGAMGRVIDVSANLSAAWGISLEEAMSTVVRGGEGMTRMLKSHGIDLDAARVASEGLAYVLPEIEKRFGSNAADQLNTYTGRVTALSVAWGNLKEAIGGAATAGGAIAYGIDKTTTTMRGLADVIEKRGVVGLAMIAALGAGAWGALFRIGEAAEAAAKGVKGTGDGALEASANLAAQAAAASKAAKAAETLADAQAELASSGEGWRGTLAKMNADVVVAVRGYLDAGVSQSALATAYGLTDAQVKAVSESLRAHQRAQAEADRSAEEGAKKRAAAEARAIEQTARLWGEYDVLRTAHGGTATQAQLADIARWEDGVTRAMKVVGADTKEFYEALAALSKEKTEDVLVDWRYLSEHSRQHLVDMAAEAQATYKAMLADSREYNRNAIDQAHERAEKTREAARDWKEAWDDSSKSAAKATKETETQVRSVMNTMTMSQAAMTHAVDETVKNVRTLAGEWINAAEARRRYDMGSSVEYDLSTNYGRKMIEQMNTGITPFLQAGYSIEQAMRLLQAQRYNFTADVGAPDGNEWYPARQAGGPVSAGQPYWVGERGPELFRPGASGGIVPNHALGGTSVTIAPGAIVLNYPIMSDPRARYELAAIVGDALITRLRGAGLRVPAGA